MSILYDWDFPALDCYPTEESLTDVIFNIHWRVTADDGEGHVASIYNTQAVTYEAGAPFTPFDQITFDQVQEWVQAAMGFEQVVAIKDALDQMIQDQISPKTVTLPAPWATPSA